jgi:hypothetical protein
MRKILVLPASSNPTARKLHTHLPGIQGSLVLPSMQLQQRKPMPTPRLPQRWLYNSSRSSVLPRQQRFHSSSIPDLTQQLQQQRVDPVCVQ